MIQELGRLPATLKESYNTIYNRITSSGSTSTNVARQTLNWMLCAQNPLSVSQLIEAVSLGSELKVTKLSASKILSVCCNLLILDTELDMFRFAHLSVREYLEGLDEYKEQDLQLFALTRCLDFLKLNTLSKDSSEDIAFGRYAALFWPFHYKAIRAVHIQDTVKPAMRVFLFQDLQTSSYFSTWISALGFSISWNDGHPRDIKFKLRDSISSPASPLFMSCRFGIPWILEEMKSFPDVS